MKLKRYLILLSVLAAAINASGDNLRVSVLTCEPGEAIYELYGHTAIRVQDTSENGRDAVFNYGVFDFNTPHFVWRFVLGKTDYQVAAVPFRYFREEYLKAGRRVWEQELHLDSVQKARLADMLWENCRPENKHYRYNYLYDNCTTRCRDMIEKVETVVWPDVSKFSFRQVIHRFAGEADQSWKSFGQDLCLGQAVDSPIYSRALMFSPIWFMRFIAKAKKHDGHPLATTRQIINPYDPDAAPIVMEQMPMLSTPSDAPFSPLAAAIVAVALALTAFTAGYMRYLHIKRAAGFASRWTLALLTLPVWLISFVVTTLYFFSMHPTVETNQLIWFFNPLTLVVSLLPFLRMKLRTWLRQCTNIHWRSKLRFIFFGILLFQACGFAINVLYSGMQRFNITTITLIALYYVAAAMAMFFMRPVGSKGHIRHHKHGHHGKKHHANAEKHVHSGMEAGSRLCIVAPAALLLSTQALAQIEPRVAPRLVVMISVDQLRTDYLEAFSPLLGDHGFRKLMREGRLYTAAQYPFAHPDGTSAPACLFSGTSPYDNGVVGAMYLDRETLRPTSAVNGFTPSLLGVSTLTDELKIATEGKAVVFSIAPEPGAAIFSAGHAANAALWLDPTTAAWTSSDYYGYPAWLSSFNRTTDNSLGETWQPLSPLVGTVNYYVGGGTYTPFEHKLKTASDFITSGLVNDKITHCALQCLHAAAMGRDAVTDILAVSYYAGGWKHQSITECCMELQDTYVRLDQAIATLITEASNITNNLLVVLTSTGYCDDNIPDLSAYRIPTGTFSMTRAQSLLNIYLCAVYGEGKYVEAVYGNWIYLDHKLIERKQINNAELLERAQDLLIQMSGVKDVYTSNRLALGAWTPGVRSLRNSYNPKFQGDIMLSVASGWHIVNEDMHTDHFSRESYMPFPLVFWGTDIEAAKVDTPVEVDCVAPTVAQVLRIRSPNACQAAPLIGVR